MKLLTPTQGLLDGMPWKPPGETDVQDTWRRFGWKPGKPAPKRVARSTNKRKEK
jgi:hypothetical protein